MAADCVNIHVIGMNGAEQASRDLPVIADDGSIFYSADVHVIWNPVVVTHKNQLKAALRVALQMVESETGLLD